MKRILWGVFLVAAGCTQAPPPSSSASPPVVATSTSTLPPGPTGEPVLPGSGREYRLKNIAVYLPGEVKQTHDSLTAIPVTDYTITILVLDDFKDYKDVTDPVLSKALLAKAAKTGTLAGEPTNPKFRELPALRYVVETPEKEVVDNLHFIKDGRFYTIAFKRPLDAPPFSEVDYKKVMDSFQFGAEYTPTSTPALAATPSPTTP